MFLKLVNNQLGRTITKVTIGKPDHFQKLRQMMDLHEPNKPLEKLFLL